MSDSSSFAGAKTDGVRAKITRTNSVMPSKSHPTSALYSGQQFPAGDGKGTLPGRPVRDRSGKVIGYVDLAGRMLDVNGRPQDKVSREKVAAEAARKRAENISAYQQKVRDSRELLTNPTTIDGNPLRPFGWSIEAGGAQYDKATGRVTDENGNDITWSQRGNVVAQQSAASAVFSELNLTDVTGAEKFLMSTGQPIDPATGQPSAPKPVDDTDSLGDRHRRQTQPKAEPSQNYMTIAAGVRWLRQLSVKDPAAYNQMVIRLRNAHYIDGKDEDLPLNGWSEVVGKAFAYAAKDAAGAASEGETRTLADWLDARGKTFADSMANEPDFQPVQRNYTDPTALAATARDAAQQLLGRALTPEEEKQFLAKFKGMETSMYDTIDGAAKNKTSATYTDPNATGQAEAFVRDPQFDADRSKQLVGSYMDVLMKMTGGK